MTYNLKVKMMVFKISKPFINSDLHGKNVCGMVGSYPNLLKVCLYILSSPDESSWLRHCQTASYYNNKAAIKFVLFCVL